MIKEGVFLGKRYEILGRIGSGGMADVYKGKDHKLNRYVAIKVLKSDYRSDQVFIQKFLSEAQAAAGLMHPNVVNVYDVGQDRGLYYMVMELVEGITLKDYIEKKGKLSAKETISISIQMVTGLQAAHNQHIIHRDIKPQNIIISKEGKVKVTDFGIARATTSTQTISTSVMGSVHYTSPEQARGGVVDQKSDIYSVGITMYEMVTGHVPFDGDSTVTVALKHLQEEIKSPVEEVPELPRSLVDIIMKCTQKNPERRYHDCESLLQDLKRSLVDPDGDFVNSVGVIGVSRDTDRTVVMSQEELERLKREQYRPDEEYDDDDDYDEDSDDDSDDYDDDDEDDEERAERLRRNAARRRKNVNSDTKKITRILMIVAGVIIALLVILLVANAAGVFSGPGLPLSTTEEQAVVPDLRGMTEDEARDELTRLKEEEKTYLGMKVETERQPSSEYAEGQIMSQDPNPGEKVDQNTTIFVVISSGEEPETVEVPKVLGEEESTAEQMIRDAGLIVKKGEAQFSSEYAEGTVMSCDPKPGTEVEEGSEVTIIISLGEEPEKTVEVPTLRNKSASEAESLLSEAGLSGSVSREYSDSVEEGYVISQSVDPGTEVEPGTTISYVVSRGPQTKYTTVPSDLYGMDQNAAETAISEAGLVAQYMEEVHSDQYAAGQVCRVSPAPGTRVTEGSTVQYWISIGPEETDTPEDPSDTGDAENGSGTEESTE